jgi:hypothetical protein
MFTWLDMSYFSLCNIFMCNCYGIYYDLESLRFDPLLYFVIGDILAQLIPLYRMV